jgi:hypothetical protein
MMRAKASFIIVPCLLIAGCYVQSLNPIYSKETLTFDLGLIGTWYSRGDDSEMWIFEEAGDSEYSLTGKFADNGRIQEAYFQAFLCKLGNDVFLDILPKESHTMPDIYQAHLVPVHSFLRLHREGDLLLTESIDYNIFKTVAKQQKTNLEYTALDDRILITASTEEIQRFFVQNADYDSLFQRPDTLYRR